MIGVHGKPGPAPIEPWLQGIAVHPMLAHKIREGELRIRRDLHAHQRPARPYRDQCRQERDLLNDGLRAASAGHAARRRSEERRVGKECVSTGRSRGYRVTSKKKTK